MDVLETQLQRLPLLDKTKSPTVQHYRCEHEDLWTISILSLEDEGGLTSVGVRFPLAYIYEKTRFSRQKKLIAVLLLWLGGAAGRGSQPLQHLHCQSQFLCPVLIHICVKSLFQHLFCAILSQPGQDLLVPC
jgi:hypothetical protein